MPEAIPNEIRIDLPDQLLLGIGGLAERCSWNVRRHQGQIWISLSENLQSETPSVFSLTRLADATNASDPNMYVPLSRLPNEDAPNTGADWQDLGQTLHRYATLHTPEGFWAGVELTALACPTAIFDTQMMNIFERVVMELNDASIWLVPIPEHLHWRIRTPGVLTAASETPEVLNVSPEEFRGFRASYGLQAASRVGYSQLWNVGLALLSPWTFGRALTRLHGIPIILFGRPEYGLRQPLAERMQAYVAETFLTRPPVASNPPHFDPLAMEGFLGWWTDRLDSMYQHVLDPSHYPDANGLFDAKQQLGVVMSLDRLWACVQDILAYVERDGFVRMALLFDALDLVQGLTGRSPGQLWNLNHVQDVVGRLNADIVDFPWISERCERAQHALHEVQNGFATQLIEDGRLRSRREDGQVENVGLAKAAAQYLRIVRDANHSFSKVLDNRRRAFYFAAHDGNLPYELPELAVVYLLELLCRPDLIRTR